MPYAKNKIVVKNPQRSGFDLSHRNSGTSKCGTITPILLDEVIGNTRVSLRLPIAAQMPPLVSDTYMNCKLKVEAFFVPMRLLSRSFEDWYSDDGQHQIYNQAGSSILSVSPRVPILRWPSAEGSRPADSVLGAGTLADYLGLCVDSVGAPAVDISAFPFLAYHLVWQEWYRNPRIQQPCFIEQPNASVAYHVIGSAPYSYHYGSGTVDSTYVYNVPEDGILPLADGFDLFSLRQRNFGLDFFTGARPSAQQGDAARVIVVQPEGQDTGFSIAALRAANSLQQFRERNNLSSPRYVDQVKARTGSNLADGVAQRPICIGAASYDFSSRGVDQQSEGNEGKNLFSGVGAQYGRAYAAGSDFVIEDFVANESGYILVNMTQVPELTYSSGVDPLFYRYLTDGSIVEMASPLLQNTGDEPVYMNYIFNRLWPRGSAPTGTPSIFGFQDRFGSFMFKPNRAHGRFRDSADLASFVLQRNVGEAVLGSDFIEIPTNFMDQVMTVASSVSGLSYWYDIMLSYKKSMPLAEFSIPSLQDPAYEHGQSIVLRRNGQIF